MAEKINPQLAAALRTLRDRVLASDAKVAELAALCASRPRSVTEEIDSIQGRRIFYNLSATQLFTVDQDGTRGSTMNFLVSQDGPFIATHYPIVMWKPIAPTNANQFGRWRPVESWPLPTQQDTDFDSIDISYEMNDSGGQRNFQNLPAPAGLLSRPDNMIPLPVPTLYSPNTTIGFTPLYETITFAPGSDEGYVPTTQGQLVVTIPGYRIVNL
jgi:hypothetical protein